MEVYLFQSEISSYQSGTIFTATEGSCYGENNELHVVAQYHFVYKFSGSPVGWYMHNENDSKDYYLGAGASPSAEYSNMVVANQTYYDSIILVREVETDETR